MLFRSAATAQRIARLALDGIHREYPNQMALVLNSDADVRSPHKSTPAFYGCYDWHSAVHGHWCLVRLLRLFLREFLWEHVLSHLLGRREFWSLEFTVTRDTLDPRADSETVIEAALARIADRSAALRIAGKVDDLRDGVAMAAHAIDGGDAGRALDRLVAVTNEAAP